MSPRYLRIIQIKFALELLNMHGWMRYATCRTPGTKRAALVGQAIGLIRHDRVLNERRI